MLFYFPLRSLTSQIVVYWREVCTGLYLDRTLQINTQNKPLAVTMIAIILKQPTTV